MKPDKKYRLVILDDDPTGIQTVHGCLLITQWDEATVRMALQHEQPFFYMLTNTRAMTRDEAARVVRSAMETVLEVNREFGYRLIFISRSDSCLRGHFPLETDVMGIWRESMAEGAFLSGSYRGRACHHRWRSLYEGW